MTDAAEHALCNVIAEYHASAQSLNIRERIDMLVGMIRFASIERLNEFELLDEIEWAGTSPMGGQ